MLPHFDQVCARFEDDPGTTLTRRGVRYRRPHDKSQGLPGTPQVFSEGADVKIRFGPFVHDLDTRQLTRDGRAIHLSPKAFELLTTLAEERPKVLSKAVLQERLWPGTFVAEANLSRWATAPARRGSSGPRTGSATHSVGTPPRCRTRSNRDRSGPRAGSSGIGGAFRCPWENTSSDAIPTLRSGSTRRRCPGVTRGSS